jgi:hypothetical protein
LTEIPDISQMCWDWTIDMTRHMRYEHQEEKYKLKDSKLLELGWRSLNNDKDIDVGHLVVPLDETSKSIQKKFRNVVRAHRSNWEFKLKQIEESFGLVKTNTAVAELIESIKRLLPKVNGNIVLYISRITSSVTTYDNLHNPTSTYVMLSGERHQYTTNENYEEMKERMKKNEEDFCIQVDTVTSDLFVFCLDPDTNEVFDGLTDRPVSFLSSSEQQYGTESEDAKYMAVNDASKKKPPNITKSKEDDSSSTDVETIDADDDAALRENDDMLHLENTK